jgi:hypothetical protein
MFEPLTAELAKDFRVVSVDIIHGRGRSGLREPRTVNGMADDFGDAIVEPALPYFFESPTLCLMICCSLVI